MTLGRQGVNDRNIVVYLWQSWRSIHFILLLYVPPFGEVFFCKGVK